jgi:hypothetical protein
VEILKLWLWLACTFRVRLACDPFRLCLWLGLGSRASANLPPTPSSLRPQRQLLRFLGLAPIHCSSINRTSCLPFHQKHTCILSVRALSAPVSQHLPSCSAIPPQRHGNTASKAIYHSPSNEANGPLPFTTPERRRSRIVHQHRFQEQIHYGKVILSPTTLLYSTGAIRRKHTFAFHALVTS